MAHINLTVKRDGYLEVANALQAIDTRHQEEETSVVAYLGNTSAEDIFGKVLKVTLPTLAGACVGAGIGAGVGALAAGPGGAALGAKIGGVIGAGASFAVSVVSESSETCKAYKTWKETKDRSLLRPFATIFEDSDSLRELQCPISQELMLFPTRVGCAGHHTFDYFPLLDWVETCVSHDRAPTCPLDREEIDPNHFTCDYRMSGRIGSIYRTVLQNTNALVALSRAQIDSLTYCSRTLNDSIVRAFDIEKKLLDAKYEHKDLTPTQYCSTIEQLGDTLYPIVTLGRA